MNNQHLANHRPASVTLRLLAGIVLLPLLAAPALAAGQNDLTDDGLVPIKVKGIDKAYKREGASLKGYKSVLIRPTTVAFSKRWDPKDYGLTFGMKADEVARIRDSLAKITNERFGAVLAKGGYTVATAPGEGVLDVTVEIVDLYVNAPDVQRAGNVKNYVVNAGEMRMLVTLRDSVTGSTLFRASDFERGVETGQLQWANSVFNRVEAERALDGWAGRLKKALDTANAN